jgi:hypothetical protein
MTKVAMSGTLSVPNSSRLVVMAAPDGQEARSDRPSSSLPAGEALAKLPPCLPGSTRSRLNCIEWDRRDMMVSCRAADHGAAFGRATVEEL